MQYLKALSKSPWYMSKYFKWCKLKFNFKSRHISVFNVAYTNGVYSVVHIVQTIWKFNESVRSSAVEEPRYG